MLLVCCDTQDLKWPMVDVIWITCGGKCVFGTGALCGIVAESFYGVHHMLLVGSVCHKLLFCPKVEPISETVLNIMQALNTFA